MDLEELQALLLRYYFDLEQRYYYLMDYLEDRFRLPVYERYVDPIEERGVPSFPVTILLIVLLLSAVFVLWPRPIPTADLVVRTLSGTGETLDDVRVLLTSADGEFTDFRTTTNGIATFEDIAIRIYSLNASKEGFSPASAEVDLGTQLLVALSLGSLEQPTPTPGPVAAELPSTAPLSRASFTGLPANTTPLVPAAKGVLRVFVKNETGQAVDARVRLVNAQTNQKLDDRETVSGTVSFENVTTGLTLALTAFASGYAPYDGTNQTFAMNQTTVVRNIMMRRSNATLAGVPGSLDITLRDSFARSICATLVIYGRTGAELFDTRACGNLSTFTPLEGSMLFREPGLLALHFPVELLPRLFDRAYDPSRLASAFANATLTGGVHTDGSLVALSGTDFVLAVNPAGVRRVLTNGDSGFDALSAPAGAQRLSAALLSGPAGVALRDSGGNLTVAAFLGVANEFLVPGDPRHTALAGGSFPLKAAPQNSSLALKASAGILLLHFDGRAELVKPGTAQYPGLLTQVDAGSPAAQLSDGTVVLQNADGTLATYRFLHALFRVDARNARTWCSQGCFTVVNPEDNDVIASLEPATPQNSVTLGVRAQREDGSLLAGTLISVGLLNLVGQYVTVDDTLSGTGTATFTGLPRNAQAQVSASKDLLAGATYLRLNASSQNATVVLRLPQAAVTINSLKVASPATPVAMNHFAYQDGQVVASCSNTNKCVMSVPIGLTTLVVNSPGLLPNSTTVVLAAQPYTFNITTVDIALGTLCSDGSPSGVCSLAAPGYICEAGVLQPRASLCGCPSGFLAVGEFCAPYPPPGANCADGTARNACSTLKPYYCTKDALLQENATQCGCPAGWTKQGETCVKPGALACTDGTGFGNCSATKPYRCSADGRLVLEPQACGCPGGFSMVNGQCLANQPAGSPPACSDGTAPNACSPLQPMQCLNGALVPKASVCGCPVGTFQVGDYCADDARQFTIPCADGTAPNTCSSRQPFRCELGQLLPKATQCGCPSGYTQVGDSCTKSGATSCADGTPSSQCSTQKPYFCDGDGQLAVRASLCGCPTGYAPAGDQCIQDAPPGSVCSDGTALSICSSTKPLYCNAAAVLEPKATLCGCPPGTQGQGDFCRVPGGSVCADGTAIGQCSSTKPLFCNPAGALVSDVASCGCPSGFVSSGGLCYPSTGGALFLEGPFLSDSAGTPLPATQTGLGPGFYYVTFRATPVGPSSTIAVGFYLRTRLIGLGGANEYASLQYLDKTALANSLANLTHRKGYNPSVPGIGACAVEDVKFLNELAGSACTSGACLSTFSEDYEWVEVRANATGTAPVTFRFGVRVNLPLDAGARQLRFDYRSWALFPNGVFVRSPVDDAKGKEQVVGGADSGPTSPWCQANKLAFTREWNCGAIGKECCANPPASCPQTGACSVSQTYPQGLCVNPTLCWGGSTCSPGNVCCIVQGTPTTTACTLQSQCSQAALCAATCSLSQFCDASQIPTYCNECDASEESLGLCENCGNENELCCTGSACNTGLACGGFVREKPCGSDPNKPILLGWRWTNFALGQGETFAACGEVIIGVNSTGGGTSSTKVLPDSTCGTITGEQYVTAQGSLMPSGCFTHGADGYIRYQKQTGCDFSLTGNNTAQVFLRAACHGAVPTQPSVGITLATDTYAPSLLTGQTVFREAVTGAGAVCVNATERWTQRLAIRVHNPSNIAYSNYPVHVLFDGAGPLARAELQGNGNDLRLVSTTGFRKEYPFWLVPGTLNTTRASLWFRLETLAANQTQEFALLYGNPGASIGARLTGVGLNGSSNNSDWVIPGPCQGTPWCLFSAVAPELVFYQPAGVSTATVNGTLEIPPIAGGYNFLLTHDYGQVLLKTANTSWYHPFVSTHNLQGTRNLRFTIELIQSCTPGPAGCTSTGYGRLHGLHARLRDPLRVYVNDVLITETGTPPAFVDTTPPVVSSLAVPAASIYQTSALVTWQTNEGADGQAFFGLSAPPDQNTSVNPLFTISHSINMTGLSPNTTYLARVRSCDPSGNCVQSDYVGFTTAADQPPAVSLGSPADAFIDTDGSGITVFTFTPSDAEGLSLVEIWTNASGLFAVNASNSSTLNGIPNVLNVSLGNGSYIWNARACDTYSPTPQCVFATANRSIHVTGVP
jgi:hypothetical protein